MSTIRLTTAQAVVRHLQAQHTERDGERRRLIPGMFGIFGHGNVAGLGQALLEHGADLPYYQPFNEQSMVHTAIGYARAARRRATLACTASIGPGSTNMLTGAATATINRLPVLLLPSDYYAMRRPGNVLQQLEHPTDLDVSVNDCFRPISRFFDRITRPEQLLDALPEAMRVLTDPVETGAVTLSLPQDIQTVAHDFPTALFEERVWTIERALPSPAAIDEVARLLAAAERPLIVAGGGVHYSEAWAELAELSRAFGIPVGETMAGKGALREGSPILLHGLGVTGTPAAHEIASDADLVLCVGTRMTDFTTGSRSLFRNPDVRFAAINVTSRDAHKLGALPVVADAREALRALIAAARDAGVREQPDHVERARTAMAAWRRTVRDEIFAQAPGERMSQGQLVGVLNEAAQDGDVILAAAGSPPGDLHQLWDAAGGRAVQLEFGFSCMGHELPAGLGVRLAGADGEVFVLIGDGTYLMSPSEIATAVQEGLKVTLVVSQNHGYQVIRRLQMSTVGTSFGNEFRAREEASNTLDGPYLEIDVAANAASLGARTWHVHDPDGVRAALREARAEPGPCVIVCETEKHRFPPGAGVFWDIAPAEVSDDPTTAELRARFDADRAAQRFYYSVPAHTRETARGGS